MAPVYPELRDSMTHIKGLLKSEEERFFKTLGEGLPMVNELIKSVKTSGDSLLPGEDVFKLYDTFGFPVDITREIASEAGLGLDESGFQTAMNAQRTRARSSWKQESGELWNDFWQKLSLKIGPVEFTGYEKLQESGHILAIIQDDQSYDSASIENPSDEFFFIISPTPFYAESGGQVGDTGIIQTTSSRIKVINTFYLKKGLPVIHGQIIEGRINVGDSIISSVQRDRRNATARHHSATHLLQSALRQVLGDHVKQSGSLVAPDKLRFDFTHFSGISNEDLEEIERLVNEAILENHPVKTEITSLDQAIDSGVIALFGEKYESTVRVLRVDDISAELCGGTHVRNTGEIGMFKILSESSVSAGIRRIEAVAGFEALQKAMDWSSTIHEISELLKAPVDSIQDRILKMQQRIKDLSRETTQLQSELGQFKIAQKLDNPMIIEGVKVVIHSIPDLQTNQLRDLSDQVKQKLGSGIIVLASILDGKVVLISAVTPDLTKSIHAGKLVGKIAELVGGGGGGRPDMAQAGGSQPENLHKAMDKVPEIIASMLSGGSK